MVMRVTPVDQIRAMYAQMMPERDFAADVLAYMQVGVVVSNSLFFLMARAIDRDDPHEWEPYYTYQKLDCWFIWAAAGPDMVSVKTFCLQLEPYPLKWVSWSRRGGPLKFHPIKNYERFYRPTIFSVHTAA
jgi:hypothetical protein